MKRIPLTPQALIVALLIVSTLVRLVLAGALNLVVDEAYLLAVTRQFQLSWYDHPPLAFWIVWGLQALFGPELSPLVLRLPFVLLFTGSTWLLYALTARLFSEKAGLWAALAFTLAPFFLVSAGSWLVPDGPLTFFLLLSANLLARLLFEAQPGPRWGLWLALGAAFGLAMLSKYHAVLFLAGAGAYLIFSPAHRHWLARPQPWAALAIALLLFTPVLVWNAANDWISFAFQGGRAGLGAADWDPGRLFVELAGQSLYVLPWTFIGLLASLVAAFRAPREFRAKAHFLISLALPAIVLFNALALFGRAILFHWPMSGWLFAFPLLGYYFARLPGLAARLRDILAALSALAVAGLIGLTLALHGDFRALTGGSGLNWIVQSTADWRRLDERLSEIAARLPGEPFLATNTWFDAALIYASVRPDEPVAVLSDDQRGFADLLDQRRLVGHDAVIVTRAIQTEQVLQRLVGRFASFEPLGSVEVPDSDAPILTLDLTLGTDFREPFD